MTNMNNKLPITGSFKGSVKIISRKINHGGVFVMNEEGEVEVVKKPENKEEFCVSVGDENQTESSENSPVSDLSSSDSRDFCCETEKKRDEEKSAPLQRFNNNEEDDESSSDEGYEEISSDDPRIRGIFSNVTAKKIKINIEKTEVPASFPPHINWIKHEQPKKRSQKFVIKNPKNL